MQINPRLISRATKLMVLPEKPHQNYGLSHIDATLKHYCNNDLQWALLANHFLNVLEEYYSQKGRSAKPLRYGDEVNRFIPIR